MPTGCSPSRSRSLRSPRSSASRRTRITAGANQYGGMKANDVKKLKELERENARLKTIVADQALQCQALKEVARGNW